MSTKTPKKGNEPANEADAIRFRLALPTQRKIRADARELDRGKAAIRAASFDRLAICAMALLASAHRLDVAAIQSNRDAVAGAHSK
jgi:hypothetical protein